MDTENQQHGNVKAVAARLWLQWRWRAFSTRICLLASGRKRVHAGRFVRRKDDVHIVSATVPSTKAAASLYGNRMKSFWTLWAIGDKRYVNHGYIQVLRSNAI